MGALDWDHNAHYWPLLLGLLPPGCERALDVGCGAGALSSELARRVPQVDAVDRSAEMVAQARSAVPPRTQVRGPLPGPAPSLRGVGRRGSFCCRWSRP